MTARGFTLIELLMVVAIIGILAAIAVPTYGRTRERAIIASMQSDLRNFAAAEESFAAEHDASYGTYDELTAEPYAFHLSGANVAKADAKGPAWRMEITNPATAVTCRMSANTGEADEGAPLCTAAAAAAAP